MTIQLSLDGFSFALFDIVYHKLIAWYHFQYENNTDTEGLFHSLEKAIGSEELGEKNPSVTLIIDDRTNTLVPESLYNPDDSTRLLDFNFNLADGTVARADTIKKIKAVNVFALSQDLQTKIMSRWPEAKIIHSSSVFLENLPDSEEASVYVNVRHHNYDIAIMKDRLLFFNNFKFSDNNDFVYFLLNVLEQNHLSGHNTSVCFSGLIQPSSGSINLCRHYVKDIRFVEKPNTLQVDSALTEVPYPYYHIHYQAIK